MTRFVANEPPVVMPRSAADGDAPTTGRAWEDFLGAHSELILRVARVVAHDHDSAMDCYVYVLDRLRENNGQRLRSYTPDAACSFATWLAVVVRRLCVDRYREKYGRQRGTDANAQHGHLVRRRLADLVGVEAALEQVHAGDGDSGRELEQRELVAALNSVLFSLDPRDRLLLALRFEDELPARQIAEIMAFPTLFHVYRQIKSVLALCREALERRGFGAPDG